MCLFRNHERYLLSEARNQLRLLSDPFQKRIALNNARAAKTQAFASEKMGQKQQIKNRKQAILFFIILT